MMFDMNISVQYPITIIMKLSILLFYHLKIKMYHYVRFYSVYLTLLMIFLYHPYELEKLEMDSLKEAEETQVCSTTE